MVGQALYFEEACVERAKDPLATHIAFTYAWLISTQEEDRRVISTTFGTNYKVGCCDWNLQLRLRQSPFGLNGPAERPRGAVQQAYIMVETSRNTKMLGGSCFLQYAVYQDDAMRYETYVSPRVAALESPGMITEGMRFKSPSNHFMDRLGNAFKKNGSRKIVITVELSLPARFFLRHFEESAAFFNRKIHRFPSEVEDDFRFKFIKTGDLMIKCPDGSLQADRQALYLSSMFFRSLLPVSQSQEFAVRHSIDVVKPVVWYLHSLCFEMPDSFDLEYTRRLIDAIDFFHPVSKSDILSAVHRALCQKLADGGLDFDTILQMASLAGRYRFVELKNMACSLIANEYYDKFRLTFPEGELNIQNPRYRDLFQAQHFIGQTPFDNIEKIHRQGFRTTLILR